MAACGMDGHLTQPQIEKPSCCPVAGVFLPVVSGRGGRGLFLFVLFTHGHSIAALPRSWIGRGRMKAGG